MTFSQSNLGPLGKPRWGLLLLQQAGDFSEFSYPDVSLHCWGPVAPHGQASGAVVPSTHTFHAQGIYVRGTVRKMGVTSGFRGRIGGTLWGGGAIN